jgi:DNA polymerase III subunit delta
VKVQPRNADSFIASAWGKVRAVLLFGPDAGLARERAKTLIASATDTAKFPFALAEISGPSFKDAPSLLRDELAAVPFGGGRRVVHVRDLTDWRMADRCAEAVAAALGSWPGDALLVVEGGELKPRAALRRVFEDEDGAAAVGCYADDAEAVRRLIGAVAKEHKLRVSTEAEDFLVERLGADRMATRGELEKLALYAGGEGRIELADAQAAIGDGGESTVDEAVHAAFRGDPVTLDRALSRCFAAGDSPIRLVRALARHVDRLSAARAGMDSGQSVEQALAALRPPVFGNQFDAYKRQMGSWDGPMLARLVDRALEAEIACKSTGMPDQVIAGRLFAEVATRARRR